MRRVEHLQWVPVLLTCMNQSKPSNEQQQKVILSQSFLSLCWLGCIFHRLNTPN